MSVALLFVLSCAVAGMSAGAALFYRSVTREVPQMALYEVKRTDDVQPGQFDSAVVIASGTAQAREAVAHMDGVIAKGAKRNVEAIRMETSGVGVQVLSAYWDEREAAPAQDETLFDADEYAGDVSRPGDFNW